MLRLTLTRTEKNTDGVFGHLVLPSGRVLFTCEEEDLGNANGVSCIPAGVYKLQRTIYHKHGFQTFEVMNVPGRVRILIHPGNTEEDTMGCILLGMRLDSLVVADEDAPGHPRRAKEAVIASQVAFRRFMGEMAGINQAELEVKWAA